MFNTHVPQYIGRNLVNEKTYGEWSDWVELPIDKKNAYLSSPRWSVTLENVKRGDLYFVQYDIEIRNVVADLEKNKENLHNGLVWAYGGIEGIFNSAERPIFKYDNLQDKVYQTRYVYVVPEDQEEEKTYYLMFGCNYLISGEIRFRGVKVSKGSVESSWTPALESGELDFIKPNLINRSSSGWSSWIDFKTLDRPNKTNHFLTFNHPSHKFLLGVDFQFRGVTYTPKEIREATEEYSPRDEGACILLCLCNTRILRWSRAAVITRYDVPIEDNKTISINTSGSGIIVGDVEEGVYNWRLDFGYDWISSGQFRYRKMYAKLPEISNPLWSPSEMDIANPNLIKNISRNDSDAGEGNIWEEIEITDCPNPYVTTGIYAKKVSSKGNWGPQCWSYSSPIIPGHTYTVSAYIRGKGRLFMFFWDSGHQGYSKYHDTIELTEDWKRYSLTYDVPDEAKDFISLNWLLSNDSECEICGFKLEEGPELSAWTPYF